ncbi:MAG TPA: polyphosphate polymerase domain-containing protein [Desulfobacterales bacterium]|nr:polyphosphate polymerase domain-containing protein [Desulfobacterales bacterium]
MMRLEYKYPVPNALLPRLRAMIAPFVDVDSYAARSGPRGYTVRSIYFDTFALDSYHGKTAGLEMRKKIRIRGYDERKEGSVIFLEIKRKYGMAITKNRAPVLYESVEDLLISGDVERYVLTGEGFPNALEDTKRFLFHVYGASLRPTVLVAYEREAYYSKFDRSLRITLDKDIRSSAYPSIDALFSEDEIRRSIPQQFVLEVKLRGGIPLWLSSIIGALGLKRRSISKYALCLDAHGMPQRRSRRAMLAFSHSLHDGSTRTRGVRQAPAQVTGFVLPPLDLPIMQYPGMEVSEDVLVPLEYLSHKSALPL